MKSFIFFNKSFRRIALSSTFALGALGASGGFAAEATSTSSASVIEPIAIVKTADLVFGKFAPGVGGSVTVATDGTRSATGAILSSVGPAVTAGKFDVTGDNDATYSISWGGVTELTHTVDALETMTLTRISDLTGAGATTGEVTDGTLSGTGAQSIYLGGVLALGGTQASGTYEGDVTVTVEYN